MAPKKVIISRKTKKSEGISVSRIGYEKELKHKYTKYYPSILDPNFTTKISHHPIFRKYKLTINKKKLDQLYNAFETNIPLLEDTKKTTSNIYILKPTQKLLRNFMSPYTPYRSLLIYHEMGVGKTCTAITIAETLKNITQNSDTKIYIIRPEEVARQIFNINVVKDGRPLFQCTGDNYLQNPKWIELIDGCMTGKDQNCEQLQSKVEKEIKKIYEFIGSQSWAREVERKIEQKTRNIENMKEKESKIHEIIRKLFNNTVIIVDEAHELRDNNEKEAKVVPPILKLVLEYASNIRLIFLSATPIYDKPQNIISLINYFLINDKRPIMNETDIFDNEGNLKPNGRNILERNTRGYITFLRGNNPFFFPIRLSAKYNIPKDIFNLAKYPTKDINGKTISKQDHIKHLELIDCPMKNAQLDIMKYHMKHDNIPSLSIDEIISMSDQASLFEYPPNDLDAIDDIKIPEYSKNVSSKKTNRYESSRLSSEGIKLDTHESSTPISTRISKDKDLYREKTVAYLMERQISNFVYQDLEECNKNIKLAYGDVGLSQIVTKNPGKWTYQFNDPKYAARFKLPELYNWGSKIAKAIELIMKSQGPVFVYTYFNKAGVIPLAFALEMNGYRRYKQPEVPLIESNMKDNTYRGDYIILTGDSSISQYAQEYLDKRQNMINEKNVKVFIGTSKASEGLNLFGYREVHILDPWHNINLIEQSIGRAIRTESHLHLPPQERNVTVYLYASTMGKQESFDLKIYKICEDKAIKAGIVEKILKENAFDCELNKELNIYDKTHYNRLIPMKTSHNIPIKISLADVEYSRNCFYMKSCDFKCSNSQKDISRNISGDISNSYPTPIMNFNLDREIYEYKNLILQLLATNPNIKIENLRQYLHRLIYGDDSNDSTQNYKSHKSKHIRKTKKLNKSIEKNIEKNIEKSNLEWEDENAFEHAIQELINNDVYMTDKFNRKGKIAVTGEYLRFIPENHNFPNISIQQQYVKNPISRSSIDLKGYITRLNEEQKRLIEEQEYNYEDIIKKLIYKIEYVFYGVSKNFNIKITMDEVIDLEFSKLNFSLKIIILKTILEKIIRGITLNENEKKLENTIKFHIVYMNDIFIDYKQNDKDIKKYIYGFIIATDNHLELYSLNEYKQFEKNQGNIKKVIEIKKNQLSKLPTSKLYGYLKYEKDKDSPIFKITDTLTKGEKKSVTGITCLTKNTNEIKKNLNKLDDKVLKGKFVFDNKNTLCNDIELLLKRYDSRNHEGKKWYYKPEEYLIYFGGSG